MAIPAGAAEVLTALTGSEYFPGGIHPPADDIPGRLVGEKVGQGAFAHARDYFNGTG